MSAATAKVVPEFTTVASEDMAAAEAIIVPELTTAASKATKLGSSEVEETSVEDMSPVVGNASGTRSGSQKTKTVNSPSPQVSGLAQVIKLRGGKPSAQITGLKMHPSVSLMTLQPTKAMTSGPKREPRVFLDQDELSEEESCYVDQDSFAEVKSRSTPLFNSPRHKVIAKVPIRYTKEIRTPRKRAKISGGIVHSQFDETPSQIEDISDDRGKVKCPHCGISVYRQNFKRHVDRKHRMFQVEDERRKILGPPEYFEEIKKVGHANITMAGLQLVQAGDGQAESEVHILPNNLNFCGTLDEGFVTTAMHTTASVALLTIQGAAAGNTLGTSLSFPGSAQVGDVISVKAQVMQYDAHTAVIVVNAQHKLDERAVAQCHITRSF